MKTVTFPNGPIKMSGNLHLPKDFSQDGSYVAIRVRQVWDRGISRNPDYS